MLLGNWDEGVPLSTDYGGRPGPQQDSSRRINDERTIRQWTNLMSDNDKLKPRIPKLADFLVAFPTVPGMEEECSHMLSHCYRTQTKYHPVQVQTPPPRTGTPLGRYIPLLVQVHPQEGTPLPEQVHPQAGTPPGQVHPLAGTPPGRYTPRRVGTHPRPPAVHAGIRSTSGQYASYWNAYLLSQIILHEKVILKHSPAKFTIVPVVTHHLTDRFGTHSVRQCKFDSPAPLYRDPRHRHVRTCTLWLTSWWLTSYLNVFLLFMQFAGS